MKKPTKRDREIQRYIAALDAITVTLKSVQQEMKDSKLEQNRIDDCGRIRNCLGHLTADLESDLIGVEF
jgi:hypothetical protein